MSKTRIDGPRFRFMRGMAIALAVSFSVFTASSSQATTEPLNYTLESLASGALLEFEGGKMVFSNFDVTLSGLGSHDFADYEVVALGDGFELKGKKGQGFSTLDIQLTYDVTLKAEYAFAAISVEASDLSGANGLSLQASDSGGEVATAAWTRYFAKSRKTVADVVGAASVLNIVENITIVHGDELQNWSSRREFASVSIDDIPHVPEPNTALMVGLGLLALASHSKRKTARS